MLPEDEGEASRARRVEASVLEYTLVTEGGHGRPTRVLSSQKVQRVCRWSVSLSLLLLCLPIFLSLSQTRAARTQHDTTCLFVPFSRQA